MDSQTSPRILVVRRDNIGDLVCTSPLISALRARFPAGYIAALVNSYNRPAIDGHPALDAIYAYSKAKHRERGKTLVSLYLERLALILHLRRQKFDYVLLASANPGPSAVRLARWIAPKHIAGYPEPDGIVDTALSAKPAQGLHEVEEVFQLGQLFGIFPPPGNTTVFPREMERSRVRTALEAKQMRGTNLIVLHISARKPSQRWSIDNFSSLISQFDEAAEFLLLWSPGPGDDPRHPGDDEKAEAIVRNAPGARMLAYRTSELPELVAALSFASVVVCSDGGAMHLAAGLGKPIVCLFGDSDATHWHPWGVPYRLLQPQSRNVSDVTVGEVLRACRELIGPH